MAGQQKGADKREILSGWKDIANHLGRGVRTVQRYERELGLPVRRLSGNAKVAVVATKPDLDSWVRSSPTEQESLNAEQKSLNAEQKSFDVVQESFNNDTRITQDRLVSEVARGLLGVAAFRTEIAELRKELRMAICNFRESILKLGQQLNEVDRQRFLAAPTRDHPRVRTKRKRRKPN